MRAKSTSIHMRERLLTDAEKDFIIQSYENPKRKRAIAIVMAIMLLPILILCIILCRIEGIKSGVFYLGIVSVLCSGASIITEISVKRLLKDIKANKLCIEEVIYDYSDKYGTDYFKMPRKSSLYATKAVLCEPDIKKGDKVILVKREHKYGCIRQGSSKKYYSFCDGEISYWGDIGEM